ncbi:hypothetical protein [Piscinibacter sp.]|uniref:hypothetical protein n=1 Tax=Piscinibacter sp. TaxID=1903157 RepID=UPI002BDDEE32|nr:hypothetical protein [Albitalea sp.]HUG24496.1 hypothetical protein [Albitalea sp.]
MKLSTVLALRRAGFPLLVALAMAMVQPAAAQARLERDGVALYWGLVPAAIASDKHSLEQMHGIVPKNGGQVHHLVVALFDAVDGRRIADAVVRAQLSEVGIVDSAPKYLTPMPVNGLASYGQLFSTAKEGPYQFRVFVRLPNRPGEIEYLLSARSPHLQVPGRAGRTRP